MTTKDNSGYLPPARVEMIFPEKWYQRMRYRLLEPLHFVGVEVPEGFITDGATVPRLFWILFPPVDRYFLAAVVHDYLLVERHGWKVANATFRKALKACHIVAWQRVLMYAAVSLYGVYHTLTR